MRGARVRSHFERLLPEEVMAELQAHRDWTGERQLRMLQPGRESHVSRTEKKARKSYEHDGMLLGDISPHCHNLYLTVTRFQIPCPQIQNH